MNQNLNLKKIEQKAFVQWHPDRAIAEKREVEEIERYTRVFQTKESFSRGWLLLKAAT